MICLQSFCLLSANSLVFRQLRVVSSFWGFIMVCYSWSLDCILLWYTAAICVILGESCVREPFSGSQRHLIVSLGLLILNQFDHIFPIFSPSTASVAARLTGDKYLSADQVYVKQTANKWKKNQPSNYPANAGFFQNLPSQFACNLLGPANIRFF